VERTLFRIHRFFFIRDSSWFQDKLPYPQPSGDTGEGSSDKNPLVLKDVSKIDFERLLWVFYNPSVLTPLLWPPVDLHNSENTLFTMRASKNGRPFSSLHADGTLSR
jgi:hypothetical protein